MSLGQMVNLSFSPSILESGTRDANLVSAVAREHPTIEGLHQGRRYKLSVISHGMDEDGSLKQFLLDNDDVDFLVMASHFSS